MAGQYQVTYHKPDNADADRRIQGLGGPGGGGWYRDIDTLISLIEGGDKFWTTTPAGQSVWIIVKEHPRSGRKYLKTEPDGVIPNNLLALPVYP
jgi:Protein of unknown function (DUF3892)